MEFYKTSRNPRWHRSAKKGILPSLKIGASYYNIGKLTVVAWSKTRAMQVFSKWHQCRQTLNWIVDFAGQFRLDHGLLITLFGNVLRNPKRVASGISRQNQKFCWIFTRTCQDFYKFWTCGDCVTHTTLAFWPATRKQGLQRFVGLAGESNKSTTINSGAYVWSVDWNWQGFVKSCTLLKTARLALEHKEGHCHWYIFQSF